ncbi:hypothetical protein GGG16DRAFT_51475 [Schizophyllum commune]
MSTLPPHVPALIGGISGHWYTLYGIRMYGHILIVQAEGLDAYTKYPPIDDEGSLSDDITLDDYEEAQKQRIDDLEIIQAELTSIKWNIYSWSYLDRKKRRLIQRHRDMYPITCPTWTSLIEEDDIVLTKIIDLYHRRGTWKGQPVELFRGWRDDSLRCIERAMRGYRELQAKGLDFSFEIIGHAVRDGKVVGYVTEPMNGRMVEYCDRKLVFSAVARLHSAGLTYNSLVDSGLMVCGGKLKFTNLAAIDVGTEQFKELDWQLVDELFSPDRRGIPNMFPSPADAEDQFTVLSIVPNPTRLYVSNFFSGTDLLSPAFRRWQEKFIRDEKRRDRRARKALLESLEGSTACSVGDSSKAATSRAASVLSEAPSTASTVARFHPYGALMRERLRILCDDNQGGDTTVGGTSSSKTVVASSRDVSLAPSWD